jgi:hypothetical protein
MFQKDDTFVQYFIISCKSLYMFRVKHSPIIRSPIKLHLQHLVLTNSVWPAVVVDESEFYMFRVKHSPIIRSSIKLYLQHLVLTNSVRPAVVVDESELRIIHDDGRPHTVCQHQML